MLDGRLHIHALKRLLLRWVSTQARPFLRSYGALQTVKIKPALVGDPRAGRILVLAPHMDDEVIGCGGTIVKHVQRGADVTVAYVTAGRHGSRDLMNLSGDTRRKREIEIVQIRRKEAENACQILGVQQAVYWEAEEFTLTTSPELPRKLAELLATLRPDLVYLPFFLEEHPDHRAISWLMAEAATIGKFNFDCLGYEVWTPLFTNYLVEISDVIQIKERALSEYHSQLADLNYIHTAFGLNAFRSALLLESKGYAEAFFYAPLKEYLELYRSFCAWS